MSYEFINQIQTYIVENNVFGYVITGAKGAALSLMIFNIINTYLKTNRNIDEKFIQNWGQLVILAILVLTSDFIMDLIDRIFVSVDTTLTATAQYSSYFESYTRMFMEQFNMYMDGADNWFEKIGAFIDSLFPLGVNFIASLVVFIIDIAELSLTTGYLLSRLFFVQVLKFLFPIVIALSTLEQTKHLLGKWIRLYIGVFVMGIIYIGILIFSNYIFEIITDSLSQYATQDGDSDTHFFNLTGMMYAGIIGSVVTFTVKASLFRRFTDFTISFFS